MINETLRSVLLGRCAPFTNDEIDEMSDQTALNWLYAHRQGIEIQEAKAAILFVIFVFIIKLLLYSIFLSTILKLNIQLEIKILIIVLSSLLAINFNTLLNKFDELEQKLIKIEYFIRVIFISIESQRLKPGSKEPAKDLLLIDLESEAYLKLGDELLKKFSTPFWLKYPWINLIWFACVIIFTWFLLYNWQYLTKLFNRGSIY